MTAPRGRRSHVGLAVAGAVVVLAGFAVALVEALHFRKGTIWVVVGTTVALLALLRWLDRRRR